MKRSTVAHDGQHRAASTARILPQVLLAAVSRRPCLLQLSYPRRNSPGSRRSGLCVVAPRISWRFPTFSGSVNSCARPVDELMTTADRASDHLVQLGCRGILRKTQPPASSDQSAASTTLTPTSWQQPEPPRVAGDTAVLAGVDARCGEPSPAAPGAMASASPCASRTRFPARPAKQARMERERCSPAAAWPAIRHGRCRPHPRPRQGPPPFGSTAGTSSPFPQRARQPRLDGAMFRCAGTVPYGALAQPVRSTPPRPADARNRSTTWRYW